MNIPLVDYFYRSKRNRLRQMMRGYHNLKSIGHIGSINSLKQELTKSKLNLRERDFSKNILGAGLPYAELVVRQYLLVHIGGINLNKALLLSAGKPQAKVVYAMPSEWYDIVEKHGFKVDRFRSSIIWNSYVLIFFFYGLIKILKIAFNFFKKENLRKDLKNYAYFFDLVHDNLPSSNENNIQKNIINWYKKWEGKSPEIATIHHSVKKTNIKRIGKYQLIYQSSFLPDLIGILEFTYFMIWAAFALLTSIFDFLRGKWWHAILLNQAVLSAQLRIIPSKFLAKEYLFHNSNWIYRPLWTYDAEKSGATISFYFYSTNNESFKRKSGYPEIPYGWKAITWSRFLVWNEHQANFVRRCVDDGEFKINIVGPIWFSSKLAYLNNIPSKTVAVFDVQPLRSSFYSLLAQDFDYYTPQVVIQFLVDIQDVLSECSYTMALKRKRDVGRLIHPKYLSCVKALDKTENFINIDSGLDAMSLIKNCDFVISIPFTSTALLGFYAGKPSIYYDPFSLLQSDDRAAHGIPIVQGKEMLRAWFLRALEKNFVGH